MEFQRSLHDVQWLLAVSAAGCHSPSSATGALLSSRSYAETPWMERGQPPVLHCSAQKVCFQHTCSQTPIPKIFLMSFSEKKSFSFIKCWEIYKIEILSLKISHLGAGVRGIQGEVDLLVEKFFQSLRKGVWWRSWIQNKPKIRKIVKLGFDVIEPWNILLNYDL